MLPAESVDEQVDCGTGGWKCGRGSVVGDRTLLDQSGDWEGLRARVRIEAERYHKATGKTEREIRYYINGLAPQAAPINTLVRQHWGIGNKLHWVLDVAFG